MTVSVQRVVQACFASVDDESWGRGLVEALAPLGQALGVHALRLERDAASGGCAMGTLASSVPRPPEIEALIADAGTNRLLARALLAGGEGAERASSRAARSPRAVGRALQALCTAFRAADMLLIRGEDGEMTILVLVVPMRRHRELAPRPFRPIAAYLSSALRVRRAGLGQPGDACGMIEAARREANAARPAGSPDAHAVWEALLAGGWTVVDDRREGARGTLLLRRASEHDPMALTARERDVVAHAALGRSNKEIAYALGIGATTVATHLRAASDKLRVPSRRSLIELFAAARDPKTCGIPTSS